MKKYIIALDQGTTSSRAIIFDQNQNIVSKAQKEFTQYYPQAGWVEHDPMEIWATQSGILNEAIAQAGIKPEEIDSIGITNQRETTLIWNKHTGKPIYNAIVWQCRRTADLANELIESGKSEMIQEKTGLIIDAYFSATKIQWILDNVEGAREQALAGDLIFGTVDTWLIYNLSDKKVHITDVTNASRTMLFNIHTLEWDKELLELFNIPEQILPTVKSSSECYTTTNIQGVDIPIAGIAGDQQAALFGQTAFYPGEAKNTYGTGCFLLMNTGTKAVKSNNGLITTIAIGINDSVEYALEGSVFVAGALLQWLRDELKIIESVEETSNRAYNAINNAGVYIVPAFTGLGAPYWDMSARGSILGLTRGTNQDHIVRAGLEAIAYQTFDVIKAMEKDSGESLSSLLVDGGASNNDFLMQFQSDILNLEVKRPLINETTALGAAYLAGLATGFFESKEQLKNSQRNERAWQPQMDTEEKEHLLARWHKAIHHTLNWLED